MLQGISRVTRETAGTLAEDAASSGTRVFALPSGIRDKKSLFRAMRESVPLDRCKILADKHLFERDSAAMAHIEAQLGARAGADRWSSAHGQWKSPS